MWAESSLEAVESLYLLLADNRTCWQVVWLLWRGGTASLPDDFISLSSCTYLSSPFALQTACLPPCAGNHSQQWPSEAQRKQAMGAAWSMGKASPPTHFSLDKTVPSLHLLLHSCSRRDWAEMAGTLLYQELILATACFKDPIIHLKCLARYCSSGFCDTKVEGWQTSFSSVPPFPDNNGT